MAKMVDLGHGVMADPEWLETLAGQKFQQVHELQNRLSEVQDTLKAERQVRSDLWWTSVLVQKNLIAMTQMDHAFEGDNTVFLEYYESVLNLAIGQLEQLEEILGISA